MAKDNVFGKWFIVDGSKSREEIAEAVLKITERI